MYEVRPTNSEQEIHSVYKIRYAVFSDEQGYRRELVVGDQVDKKETTINIILKFDNVPAGTARLFPTNEPNVWQMGRLAVLKAYRDKKLANK